MADFVMQEPTCGSFNFAPFVGGTQLGPHETCGQLIQCIGVGVLHCDSVKENGTFDESVAAQVANVSPDIGRRHFSYVPESVQLEVDGINSQALTEYQPLKDSPSPPVFSSLQPLKDPSSVISLNDLEFLADLSTGTEEWSLDSDIGDNSTHPIHLPDIEIFSRELDGVRGCSNTHLQALIPEKEANLNSLLAVTPSGPASTAQRQVTHRETQIKAPKKRPLYQEMPFADKRQEKRRKDAVRAKRNRDLNKERSSLLQEEKEARLRVEEELAESRRKCAVLEKFLREKYGEQLLASLYSRDAQEIQCLRSNTLCF